MVDCNMALSFCDSPNMATVDFRRANEDPLFHDLGRVLTMAGRYSNFTFKDNYRLSDNYLAGHTNCIILDFDEDMTIEKFIDRAKFAFALGTTKSHLKEKTGIVSERFRVIIPTETAVTLNAREFSMLMKEIFMLFPEADDACKDTARAYSGYRDAAVLISGTFGLFDWEPIFEKAEKREALRRWQIKERSKPTDYEFTQDDIFKAMESKFKKIYTAGARNSSVADIILWAKKENIDYPTIETFVTNLVEQSGDPLDDREMAQMFKYHFRR